MTLYKYLPPTRLDILERRLIRFTQPGAFNDPFEFRPIIKQLTPDDEVKKYVEEHFEELVSQELAQYGRIVDLIPPEILKQFLLNQKSALPLLFKQLEPAAIQALSPKLDDIFNLNVGLLCLSEIKDSNLMWSHYTEYHRGFVVGFDSDHPFFSCRRSNVDEFGYLRRVNYVQQRPQVTLSESSSPTWFATKSSDWSYEKEWRIVRVLSDADHRINHSPYPICLFEFKQDAVVEIVAGMRTTPAILKDLRALAEHYPRAKFTQAYEDSGYNLLFNVIA